MFQKYLLKGREYLSNKLEQYNVSAPRIDYVSEQIPNRLKQPLQVLQQEQIDIEDAQVYETYFKSYPNHHLSHFLLDKYNMMIEAGAEAPPLQPPASPHTHLPEFDLELERKALLFREVIQEYDEGYAKNDEPIACICVINFHHKRGTEIEHRFPQSKAVEQLEQMILHHAMPDSSHNKHEDYNFFNFEADYKGKKRMLFGVSYFKQIKLSEAQKKDNSEFTRSYLQKAVAIVSTLPLFGYLKLKLSVTTKAFFDKFTNFEIIEAAYKQLNKHLADSWPSMQMSNLYIGSDLKTIIKLFGAASFYEIWKAVLYQKRIVVFAHSSSSASSFILSLLSLFPGVNTFGIFSKPIAKYMQSLREFGMPLRLFNVDNFLSISFHIQDFYKLAKFKKSDKGNFLLGTTNRLLKQSNDYGIELLVNLENCSIEKLKARRPWEGLHKKEKKFIESLEQIVNKPKGSGYEGSQDEIRDHFHNFLKGGLTQIVKGIKAFDKFISDCAEYQKNHSKGQQQTSEGGEAKKQQFFPPLFPQQTNRIIFPELILQKSFAYFRQFRNQNLPEIVEGKLIPSLFITNYDYLLRLSAEEFISYNWEDKKLSFGRGAAKNFEGKEIRFALDKNSEGQDLAKSIYVGKVEQGRYYQSGCYMDNFEHYEGDFQHGSREGYGKLTTQAYKYLGDFHMNMFEGEGQLIVDGDIYVGQFQRGMKHGQGTIQGKFNFEGTWQNDKPVARKQQPKVDEIQSDSSAKISQTREQQKQNLDEPEVIKETQLEKEHEVINEPKETPEEEKKQSDPNIV